MELKLGKWESYPVGREFRELEDCLQNGKKFKEMARAQEFRVRRYYDSDLGQIGVEQGVSIISYLHLSKSMRQTSISGHLDAMARRYYLKELTLGDSPA